MNIFEFLGLAADHRAESKVTQLVKHYDEVTDKHKNKKFVGQVKKDGVCSLTVIQGDDVAIFSRTGKRFTNTSKLERDIGRLGLPRGIYLGEMCCKLVSLEVLSGVTNPNRVNPLKAETAHIPDNLEMHWFDVISLEAFKLGKSKVPFKQRHGDLMNLWGEHYVIDHTELQNIRVITCVELPDEEAIDAFIQTCIDNGEEGGVIRDPEADWEAGHKGWRVMKKVRGVSYDLTCIGYEEGTGKYKNKVANLIFNWKGGKTIKCMLGKGWTHEDAADMFIAVQQSTETFGKHDSPIGQIFEVYALEESSKGKLRLPKVGEHRHDKVKADV